MTYKFEFEVWRFDTISAYPLGKTEAEVEAELKGVADADRIRPHKVFEGNRVRRLAISSMKTEHA